MEKETPTCLARLPSRKSVLIILVVVVTLLTLLFVHLSGQWVGQKVFKNVYLTSKPIKRKQAFNGSLTRQMSVVRTSKKTGTPQLDLKDGRIKSDDVLLDEKSASGTKASTLTDPTDLWFNRDSLEKSVSKESVFRQMQNLDPKNTDTHAQHTGTLDQTNSVLLGDKTPGLFQAIMPEHQTVGVPIHTRVRMPPVTIPGNQTSGAPVSTTVRSLQGAIREATKLNATKTTLNKNKLSLKNSYNWNDRDPKSFTKLPLHRGVDEEWKREEALIFNRVGKCGSRNVIGLLRKLADMNNFNLVNSIVYNTTSISSDWQRYIAKTLDQVKTPYLFQRHLHFVNFKNFNARQPKYINIIRDPLARFVSNYYFRRFGDGRSNQHFKGSEEDKYRSVTNCILKGYRECVQGGIHYIIPFFCGQEKSCRKSSQWALDQAKENVEKHFVAVGILEDLESSYRVFEKLLPRFFKGVVKLFLEPDETELLKNSSTLTKFKEKPSLKAEAAMKFLMKYEFDFYYFVKDRLQRLKTQYGIGNKR